MKRKPIARTKRKPTTRTVVFRYPEPGEPWDAGHLMNGDTIKYKFYDKNGKVVNAMTYGFGLPRYPVGPPNGA